MKKIVGFIFMLVLSLVLSVTTYAGENLVSVTAKNTIVKNKAKKKKKVKKSKKSKKKSKKKVKKTKKVEQ